MVMIVQSVYIYTTNTFIFIHFYHRIRQKMYVTMEHKSSLKSLRMFVEIAKNTFYGSKLSIYLLCQKSLGY